MAVRVAILGGGFAGVLAARRLVDAAGSRVAVTLASANDAFVERVRFHELAAGRPFARYPLASLLARHGVTVQHARAIALDPQQRRLELAAPDGTRTRLDYDLLVYALGSHVDQQTVPGADLHTESVADEPAARRLAAAIAKLPDGAEVIVCGGGMTGVEVATELAEAYPRVRVRIVSRDPLCAPLHPRAAAYLDRALARLGITVEVGRSICEVRAGELVLDDGPRPFSLCVWAASFGVPALARDAGLDVTPSGQLAVDATLRSTSHPEIFGAGDAAMAPCAVPLRMGCATAMPMAAQTVANLLAHLDGKPGRSFRLAYVARYISLGRRDALAQFLRANDAPLRWYATGRIAGWLKEATFRMNLFALQTGIFPWQVLLLIAPKLAAPNQKQLT